MGDVLTAIHIEEQFKSPTATRLLRKTAAGTGYILNPN
jgi:hypothetical protein